MTYRSSLGKAYYTSGLVLGLVLMGLSVPGSSKAAYCQEPIVITEGGTYTGCWSSKDPRALAVTIATSEPVTLRNCVIKGHGNLVGYNVPHVKLSVTGCRFYGLYTDEEGRSPGYAIELHDFDYIWVEHSSVERSGGFKAVHWAGVQSVSPVRIRFNVARNVDGRKSDGKGGYSGSNILQFVQLDGVRNASGIEISWNQVRNEPFRSSVEDNISLFQSGGTEGSPIDVHDNYIEGGYPPDPVHDKYSGGGILVGDFGGEWIVVRDNQVVSTTNYGVSIAGGSHNVLRNNRVVSSGSLTDGRKVAAQNVGMYIWNTSPNSKSEKNSAYDNVSGWTAANGGRNDWWLPDCSDRCSNIHLNGDAPITRDDEAAEYSRWRRKLADAGVTVGPSRSH